MSILWASSASGQELYVFGGVVNDLDANVSSYSWALEYRHGLGMHSEVSVSYLNEGHLPDNHRDGVSTQFWGRINVFHRRFSLAAGIGPYFYYDTLLAQGGHGFHDSHGIGALASIAGTWYADSRWLVQMRTNLIGASNSINTYSLMLGIGYQLDAPPVRGPLALAPLQRERTTNNEITAFVGQTIANSFNSPQSTAESIEYRRGLASYLDWSVAWLYEGDNRLIRRNGIISQLWAVREFDADHIALGVGLGPYILLDKYRSNSAHHGGDQSIAAMVSLSVSYRFTPDWAMRLSWNRLATNYDSDADVLMVGPSYRF